MHEYCENALLKLHQPIILQNFVSCKHLAKLLMIMIVVYNDFFKNFIPSLRRRVSNCSVVSEISL